MRAVVVRNYGGPEALEVVDVPDPETRRGQVRIRVEAAAVNPVDIATRQGLMNKARPGVIREREHVGIGWDVAGTIDAIGPEVTAFAPGDRVIGLRDRLDRPLGTYAERIVLERGRRGTGAHGREQCRRVHDPAERPHRDPGA